MPRRSWGVAEQKIVAALQKWRCASCTELLPSSFEVDHIVPLWSGGPDCFQTNAQALCPTCHSLKTQREAIERSRLFWQKRVSAIEDARAVEDARADSAAEKRQQERLRKQAAAADDVDLLSDNPFLKFAFVPKPKL